MQHIPTSPISGQNLCHVCGEPGQVILVAPTGTIYTCRTSVFDVVQFDRPRILRRELPPQK